MILKIDTSTPTILLRNKMQNIVNDHFKPHGLTYFQYLRCHNDGSISLLMNNTSLFEYFTTIVNKQPVVFSSIEENQESLPSYWFLWDEKLPSYPVKLAKEFGIHNGLTLVRRNKNYYDMIAVALSSHQENLSSFYFNKLKLIEHSINQFDLNHKDLINYVTNNPFMLPKGYRDINYKKMCLTNNRIKINGVNSETYITTREFACLKLLLQGATYKQIAQILDISPRTVETYIERIKKRSGYSCTAGLSSLIELCP